jgi:hypothetical protein
VFARKADAALTSLVKKLDAEVAKAGKGKMAAAVIFLSDDDGMKDQIEKFKETNNIKHVSLALDGSKGPEAYKLSKDAYLTAILYKGKKVKVNHAFEKFEGRDVEAIMNDMPKILEVSKGK